MIEQARALRSRRPKLPFPIDKREWQPSLIPGPVTLISTRDAAGRPNVAPKSWVQMVSFSPPTLMFSGRRDGTTERNLIDTGCFGVNVVHSAMAATVFGCLRWSGEARIKAMGITLGEATLIRAPLVADCRAHIECRVLDTKEVAGALVVFGEIVAASVDEDILRAPPRARYGLLGQALFLEDGLYAAIDRTLRVDEARRRPE